MTGPQHPPKTDRSDADDVEAHACPKCEAQPERPCRSRGGAVASAYHTRRFTTVPRLKKALWVPTPADRGPGQPWRPGNPPPTPFDPDLPGADIRIGYARCSPLGQELDSQPTRSRDTASLATRSSAGRSAPASGSARSPGRRCGRRGRSRRTPRTAGSASRCTR
ncbi:zinc finger domain-containing protein [Streptomyces nitrosporeus]|uniref:zinc finger domain-containing protein n=1 Tax=Streptomyces nitrosporeus TaxID=28894 RepID=UPI003CC73105